MESSFNTLVELEKQFRSNRNKRYYSANADAIKTARQQRYTADIETARAHERAYKQAQKVQRLKARLATSSCKAT